MKKKTKCGTRAGRRTKPKPSRPPPAPTSTATVVAPDAAPSVAAAPAEPEPPPAPPAVVAIILDRDSGRSYSIEQWRRRAWLERWRPPPKPPRMRQIELGKRPKPGDRVVCFTSTSAAATWTYGVAPGPPWFFLRRERRGVA